MAEGKTAAPTSTAEAQAEIAKQETKGADAVVETAKKVADTIDVTTDNYTGDVPETLITNAMAHLPGFPARKADGELVDIVLKEATASNTKLKLIDVQGNEYQENEEGLLVDYVNDAAESKNVQPPYGMTQKSAEKATAARNKAAA